MRDPLPIASPNFAAVLLAGGRSSRMGSDKASLVIDGQPLWQRQLATLRALSPCELYVSGRRDGPYAGAGVEIIEDASPGLGPLSGIAAALRRAESPLVLILAIDMPAMTPAFLTKLLQCGAAIVPESARYFEPLAAIYPRLALPIAEKMLSEGERSMQHFIRRLVDAGLVRVRPVADADLGCFQNVNERHDLK